MQHHPIFSLTNTESNSRAGPYPTFSNTSYTEYQNSFFFPEEPAPERTPSPIFNYNGSVDYQSLTTAERDIISQADSLAYDQAGCRMI